MKRYIALASWTLSVIVALGAIVLVSPSHAQIAVSANDNKVVNDNGVVKVDVTGSVMAVHVTPATYRLLLSDRVEGNKIMRGWQNLAAENDAGATGVGAVMLYSDGQKVAEADKNIWSGEIKVRWLDD